MIEHIQITNLGPLAGVDWKPSPRVNVVIGRNATGKTLLLKMLWTLVRSREQWQLNDERSTFREIVEDKLYWTFQVERLGQLVRRGGDELRACLIEADQQGKPQSEIRYGSRAERRVRDLVEPTHASTATAVFVPAKEVLSVATQVKQARNARQFGFAEPTFDLVTLLERPVTKGAPPFGHARRDLERLVGARLDHVDNKWVIKDQRWSLPVSVAAEGHKKIAIFDRLLLNRSLRKDSIVFIDEPEAFLHPEALLRFLRILLRMSQDGVQLFLATHSLLVLNALRLYAESTASSVSVLSLEPDPDGITVHDLRQGMPPNAIVETSTRLYEMEMMGRFDD